MDNYIKIDIKTRSQEEKEILIAELSELGYEFQEERETLSAFIMGADFNKDDIDNILSNKSISYSLSDVLQQNWNAEWEAGFTPVVVDDYCCVRASFHAPMPGVAYDLIITPRMSFGTGHHATTYMMIQAMRKIALSGKSVFDFGTGTGVLAILAHKAGAGKIVAIDNDDWSIENATTNFLENNVPGIRLLKAEAMPAEGNYELILANINRNIILQHLPFLKQHLVPGGVVLLSGLLQGDRELVMEAAEREGLRLLFELERDTWICLAMER